ncbi:hypothetical protein QNH08_gp30 [Aeromonas phage pAh6.2TG]|uniref:Uncharacterized protein n=2 Tax=Phayathaivirus TaxID=3153015 RepID=A0A8F3HM72_9CAUD|nr:hypothetical protein QNH08_gp30 [Aeromonas phage pAh6.2TG]YP_010845309.1 hypothetical protein QNH09_gp27 [Aeromonas phage PVN03]QLI47627.1 hypothetical protein [Aeromonas phage PVN02]QTQ06873.1 hypothetical protein [Aeromonas phage PVN04]QTQ06940.1 hypothetical protein [Aeromonas phage PVN05]QTQ06809.1 hypothetical protein [Aeromonas phage PVN03]QWY14062.1 hypothetical protein [Aeromonas phage pAh6.2TG]
MRKSVKAMRRQGGKKLAASTTNWQKAFKKAMTCNRGFDKVMAFVGRGIAVQRVKNAKAGV